MTDKTQSNFNLNAALAGVAIVGSLILFKKLMKLESQVKQNND